jgi:DNA polymerase III epsilon subunit-like protein
MSADAGGRPPEESGPVAREAPGALDDVALYGLPLVALDFETTGLAAYRGDAVCEVGLVAAEGGRAEVLLSTFVDPGRPLSEKTKEITGIQDSDLTGAPRMTDVLPEMLELIGSAPLVMHNAPFDLHFLFKAVEDAGLAPLDNLALDTLLMARFLDRNPEGNSLRATAEYHGVGQDRSHRAADDALTTALAYHALVPYLELRGVSTLGHLMRRRLAGRARLFVERTSSVLLDLVGRAIDAGLSSIWSMPCDQGRPPFSDGCARSGWSLSDISSASISTSKKSGPTGSTGSSA